MKSLEVGDQVPHFSVVDDRGQMQSLSDYVGKKLVLFFYPKANTPGCTAEACDLRDHFSELKNAGYALLGVSADPVKKQRNFSEKFDFPFPLLADEEKEVINAFGVWGPKKFMGKEFMGTIRSTFLIDNKGKIKKIWDKVKVKGHAEQVLNEVKKLK